MASPAMSYYELLEVGADATAEEIGAAYERARGNLAADSLITYTMLDDDPAQARLSEIDEAYATLSDPERRQAYDRQVTVVASQYPAVTVPQAPATSWSVVNAAPVPAVRQATALPPPPVTPALTPAATARNAPVAPLSRPGLVVRRPPPPAPVAATRRRIEVSRDIPIGQDTEFSGAFLRRLRESAGVSTDEVAEISKIRKHYVEAIESHDFDTLPAEVYVRGFVVEYAKVLGLDPQQVARSYMSIYRRYRERGNT
jgi:hypothetical protein